MGRPFNCLFCIVLLFALEFDKISYFQGAMCDIKIHMNSHTVTVHTQAIISNIY